MALSEARSALTAEEPDLPNSRLHEARDLIRLAAPVSLGLLCNRLVGLTSTVLVGRRDATELAAVGLAVSLANVSGYSILVGISTTLQTTAGQAFGAKNFREVSLSIQRCGLLCSLALCLIAAAWLNAERLLRAVGQEEVVSKLAARYLSLLLPGVCCYMVTQCTQNWLAAQRITSPSGTGGFINAAMYFPVCWTLVYPLGFGFEGAAMATSLSNAFLMLWMLGNARKYLRTTLPNSWQGFSRAAFTQWSPFLRLALPNFLMISEWWAAEIAVLMSGVLPDAHRSLAAMAMAANTNSICFMAPLSLSIATNTRVSNELGAGKPLRARRASTTSMLVGLCLASFTATVVLLFRRVWVHVFTQDEEIMEHALPIMSLSGAYVLADGMAVILSGSLKGCGRHPLLAPVVIVAYYFVGLPCCWLFAWRLQLNTLGLALGSTVGTYCHCLVFLLLLLTTPWRLMAERARARNAKPRPPQSEIECDERQGGG